MKKIYALGVLLFFLVFFSFFSPHFFAGKLEESKNEFGDYISSAADKASQKFSVELSADADFLKKSIDDGIGRVSLKAKNLAGDYVYNPLRGK